MLQYETRATERRSVTYHMGPKCYLPPNTGERVLPQTQPDKTVLHLPTAEKWKVELTLVSVINIEMVYLSAESRPS